jgi:hypothetical protein
MLIIEEGVKPSRFWLEAILPLISLDEISISSEFEKYKSPLVLLFK